VPNTARTTTTASSTFFIATTPANVATLTAPTAASAPARASTAARTADSPIGVGTQPTASPAIPTGRTLRNRSNPRASCVRTVASGRASVSATCFGSNSCTRCSMRTSRYGSGRDRTAAATVSETSRAETSATGSTTTSKAPLCCVARWRACRRSRSARSSGCRTTTAAHAAPARSSSPVRSQRRTSAARGLPRRAGHRAGDTRAGTAPPHCRRTRAPTHQALPCWHSGQRHGRGRNAT
jgi:hypothetical protein